MAARDSEHVNTSQCCGGGGQNDRKGQLHARLVMLCQLSGRRALGGGAVSLPFSRSLHQPDSPVWKDTNVYITQDNHRINKMK